MLTAHDVTRMISVTFGGYVTVSNHSTPGVCMLGEPTQRRSVLVSTLTRMEAAGRIKINRDKRKRMHSVSFVTWIPMIPRQVFGMPPQLRTRLRRLQLHRYPGQR